MGTGLKNFIFVAIIAGAAILTLAGFVVVNKNDGLNYLDSLKNKASQSNSTQAPNESTPTLKGAVAEEAISFCTQKGYHEASFSQYLNFDNDGDQEILGACDRDGWGGYLALFVIDKTASGYQPVLLEERSLNERDPRTAPQRYFKFADVTVLDVDKDGIDEILYRGAGWSAWGARSSLNLYAPKFQEWFEVLENYSRDLESGDQDKTIEFSENFDPNNMAHRIFMEKLLEILEGWSTRPSRWRP